MKKHSLKGCDGKNRPENHGTTEDFRVVSSPPAKKTKVRHENETTILKETGRRPKSDRECSSFFRPNGLTDASGVTS